jgi:putative phosphoribosyl transferase
VRNRLVAERLHRAGLATLLFDLITQAEEALDTIDHRYRFDVDRLARRLVGATDWAVLQPETIGLPTGYFGASTGAAVALVAAAQRCGLVRAIVSRGGRVELAEHALVRVRAPTLLVVGGLDADVLRLNREVYDVLLAPKRLEIVPGATHLFEEPGALARVADLAGEWFERHLASQGLEARA